jgi:hypothetical protein
MMKHRDSSMKASKLYSLQTLSVIGSSLHDLVGSALDGGLDCLAYVIEISLLIEDNSFYQCNQQQH